MSAPDMVHIIKDIIGNLQSIGLHVMATVCDQLSTNTKCIKMLLEETRRKHLGEGTNMFGFSINGREVVPMYDVPHLLKGLRNNLLRYNAKFERNGEYHVASWDDILKIYEMDVGDSETRALNKLTDAHVIKDKIKKMKVKCAAQVFSHRVSSTMRLLIKSGK